jgi:hypothetical protein
MVLLLLKTYAVARILMRASPTPVAMCGAFGNPHQDAGYAAIRGFIERLAGGR